MFFILFIALAVFAVIASVKIKAEFCVEQREIKAALVLLWFIRLRRIFVLKRDKDGIALLCEIKKDGSENVKYSLAELICRLNKKKRNKKERARSEGFNYVYKKMKIDFKAKIDIGLGDACLTALFCGALKAAFGFVKKAGKPKNHIVSVDIKPDFTKQLYRILADCIITVTPANIIIGYFIYQLKLRR